MSRKDVKRQGVADRNERGLTAIELAVVVAILAILAAMVAGNTAGMSTAARGSAKTTDIAEVQKAVDNYKGQHPSSYYPISPASATITSTATIDFDATFTTPEGVTKIFVPHFMQRDPKHARDTGATANSWKIDANGTVANTLEDSAY